ncbi:hypothetical protein [Enterobacter cloacae complex sp. 418I7]|uniref:hypothetical protein n=1 Tax=Enterobacter cloacae complex sp. 418I7 TaxID=3395839 RepID=UPI003CEA35B2
MITITQKEYDAAAILSNALKKYNGKVSDKNLLIDTGNKSLQTKVERSYKYLRENNRLRDLGFITTSALTESEKEYQNYIKHFSQLCELYDRFPNYLEFSSGEIQIPLRLLSNEFVRCLSNIDIEQVVKIKRADFTDGKFGLKKHTQFKNIDDFNTRLLCSLLNFTFHSKPNIGKNKTLLLEHVKIHGCNDLYRCFHFLRGMILTVKELDFSANEIFILLQDRINYAKKEYFEIYDIEMLNEIDEKMLMDLYIENKEVFSFSQFSHKGFNLFLDKIKNDDYKKTYIKAFVADKLIYDGSLSYIKKMMKKLTEDDAYQINKQMLEYCKDKGRDYSSYEKEVIKYELKLDSGENKKTKRRL